MSKKRHPKKVQHEISTNINKVQKEKCQLLRIQHGKSVT